jgi:hypothetical protein
VSTLAKPPCNQLRREPLVSTAHIDVAHEAMLTIPKTSVGVGADTLERFLRKYPQIDRAGGVPRYLVRGSLAVAALTGNQRCWEGCADIYPQNLSGRGRRYAGAISEKVSADR